MQQRTSIMRRTVVTCSGGATWRMAKKMVRNSYKERDAAVDCGWGRAQHVYMDCHERVTGKTVTGRREETAVRPTSNCVLKSAARNDSLILHPTNGTFRIRNRASPDRPIEAQFSSIIAYTRAQRRSPHRNAAGTRMADECREWENEIDAADSTPYFGALVYITWDIYNDM